MRQARASLCWLLLLNGASANAAEHVIPAITPPMRIEWGVNREQLAEVLSSHGMSVGIGVSLHPPEWNGTQGWRRSSGTWSQFDGAEGVASYYFDAGGSLQRFGYVVGPSDGRPWRTQDESDALAASIHQGLSSRYGECGGFELGHRCSWSDELGFQVSFAYESDSRDQRVWVYYWSAEYDRAVVDTDEF